MLELRANLFWRGRGVDKSLGMAVHDYEQAAQIYEVVCDRSQIDACIRAGRLRTVGLTGHGRRKDGLALVNFACDSGSPSGCAYLGDHYRLGVGITQDIRRAFTLYEQACSSGSGYACHQLGRLYSTGHGVKKNQELSKRLQSEACALGDVHGCLSQGRFDRGVTRQSTLQRCSSIEFACSLQALCSKKGVGSLPA